MEKVSKRIEHFNTGRLPDIVAYKYKAMAENLYRFYRGTNHLFYEDLKDSSNLPPAPITWLCGDLHLENFGSFKSDNRLVYFDLNDFDDAYLGPSSYELVRFTTSIFIAFDTLQIEQKKALNIAQLFLRSYAATLVNGKQQYIERQSASGIIGDFLNTVGSRKVKDILRKKAIASGGEWKLKIDNVKQHKLTPNLKKEIKEHFTEWLKNDDYSPYNYEVKDVVFRVAGTGSLGVKRYMILLKSKNNYGEKYIVVEMKQAMPSALLPYFSYKQPHWKSEAERVIEIQKRAQNRSPAFLSATIFKGESFIVEEMQPMKDSIDFNLIKSDYRKMCQVINNMAVVTASAQLRSGGQQGSAITDELKKFGLQEKWQDVVINYSIEYAQQVKSYYLLYLKDYKKNNFK